jgi:dynein heavy chain, axonemal
VCFLLLKSEKPKKPNDPKKLQYDPDGWFELSKQKLLSEPKKFLENMINYDKDNIPDTLITKIKPMMEKEELSEKKVANASGALVAVRVWILAMITYHEVLKIVNPKRAIAAEMGAKLAIVQANLAEKQAQVREINAKLDALQKQMDMLVKKEKDLSAEIEDCNKKLVRAEKMIGGLEGEKVRWTDTVKTLGEKSSLLVGDCLVAAGMVSYAGPFTASYRLELEEEWRAHIKRLGLKHTPNINMRNVLGDDVIIRIWSVAGLPNDNLSIENGIILFKSRRWPLMIDPQTQANKFIKNMGKNVETGLDVFKLSEGNLLRNLELAIQFGKWVLLENIGEELDPALEPILLQQKVKSGSGFTIKMGEKTIAYNESFKFFMTTTLPNPHYTPETSVKVTILNFAITPQGLEEQMLNLLVQLEMPELQEKKNQIVEQNAQSAKQLRDIEDMILHGLTKHAKIADILETDELIDVLAESKKTSE